MMQALHDKSGHPSDSKFVQIYRAQNRVGFSTNFLALLNHFRCKVCALCKGARGYRRSTRVQLHGPHKTAKAVPAPGDIVFCNSNDDSSIGVVTAALFDDLFTVLMPTQHAQTFSLSDLSLAEEIVDTDNSTAEVGGDRTTPEHLHSSIISSFMQMEWRCSGVLRPPHALSPTN